jgi:SAM-dependent methyltransferase
MSYRDAKVSETEPTGRGLAQNAPPLPGCPICGGRTVKRFSKECNGMDVDYLLCLSCSHLTAGEISKAPRYDGGEYFKEIDTGWKERNATILRMIKLLTRLPGIRLSARSTVLDFGCGTGRLVSDLNHAGFRACGFEPYPESGAASENLFTDWNQARQTLGPVDLLACIEVLEHLRDPDDFMQKASQALAPGGYLLISTGIFNTRSHDEDWWYLGPEAGHVSIFSENSLRLLLDRYQFQPIFRGNDMVWLFRSVATRRRTLSEREYFALSQMREWVKVRVARFARKALGAGWRPPTILRRLWENL